MGTTTPSNSQPKVYYSPTPGWKPKSDPTAVVIYLSEGKTTGQTSQGSNTIPAGLPVQEQGYINGKPIGNIGNYIINTIKENPQKVTTVSSVSPQYLSPPNSTETQSYSQKPQLQQNIETKPNVNQGYGFQSFNAGAIDVKQFYSEAIPVAVKPTTEAQLYSPDLPEASSRMSVIESIKTGHWYETVNWATSGFGLFDEGPKVGDISVTKAPYQTRGTATSQNMPLTTTIRAEQQYDILAGGFNVPIKTRAENLAMEVSTKYSDQGNQLVKDYATSQQAYLNTNVASLQNAINTGTITQAEAQKIADYGVAAANFNISEYAKSLTPQIQSKAQEEYSFKISSVVKNQELFNLKYGGMEEKITPATAAQFTTYLFLPQLAIPALMISGASRVGTSLNETDLTKAITGITIGVAETAIGFYGASRMISNYENMARAKIAVNNAVNNQIADIESNKLFPLRVEKAEGKGFTEYLIGAEGHAVKTTAKVSSMFDVEIPEGGGGGMYSAKFTRGIIVNQFDYLTGKPIQYGSVEVVTNLGQYQGNTNYLTKLFSASSITQDLSASGDKISVSLLKQLESKSYTFNIVKGEVIFKPTSSSELSTYGGFSTKVDKYTYSEAGKVVNKDVIEVVPGMMDYQFGIKGITKIKALTVKSPYSGTTFDFEPFGNTGLKANMDQVSSLSQDRINDMKSIIGQLNIGAVTAQIKTSGYPQIFSPPPSAGLDKLGSNAAQSATQQFGLSSQTFASAPSLFGEGNAGLLSMKQPELKSISIAPPSLNYYSLSSLNVAPKVDSKPSQIFSPGYVTKEFTTQFQTPSFVQADLQKIKSPSAQMQLPDLAVPTSGPLFDFSFSPKFPWPIGLPNLNFNEGYRSRQGGRRGYKYTPGIAALGLDITSTSIPLGAWTGLVTRPQVRQRRRR